MVGIDTAIDELNTGIIEFHYPNEDGCTTEGEVVILLKRLKRLKEFNDLNLEPYELKDYIKAVKDLNMLNLINQNNILKSEIEYLKLKLEKEEV